ncbi:MAG: tripartite tricarboxylate transporter substrate binding protein [Burkholderiales bacterium]|nr:tripartite tricarboxylate transporter substrate binding protein [Burkholderiales bacterium]
MREESMAANPSRVTRPRPDRMRVVRRPGRGTLLQAACASFCAVILAATSGAGAQAWPARPVRLVVGNAPGAAVDTGARIIANSLGARLGQAVVVDNRPGADGYIAAEAVVRAAPDGYTLYLASQSVVAIDPHLKKTMPFDVERDFTPIATLVDDTFAHGLFAHPSAPFSTMQEMLAYARAHPRKLSIAISVPHFAMLASWLDRRAGIETLQVPYKSASQAVQDTLAGRVSLFLTNFGVFEQYVKAGKVRVLAVTRPIAEWPQIPSYASLFPGFTFTTFFALAGPGGMARDLVNRINREVAAVVEAPKFNQDLAKIRWRNVEGARTPEGTAEYIRQARADWGAFIRQIGLQPQ